MKKGLTILALSFLIASTPVIMANASTTAPDTFPLGTLEWNEAQEGNTIEYLDNGDYLETVITETPAFSGISTTSTTNTTTKTKTTYYKNSSGTVLWSAYIKATFSYNGSTAKCTSCSHGSSIKDSQWSISSISSSKSGNKATTNVTAKRTLTSGATQTIDRSVTIQCSADGVVS